MSAIRTLRVTLAVVVDVPFDTQDSMDDVAHGVLNDLDIVRPKATYEITDARVVDREVIR